MNARAQVRYIHQVGGGIFLLDIEFGNIEQQEAWDGRVPGARRGKAWLWEYFAWLVSWNLYVCLHLVVINESYSILPRAQPCRSTIPDGAGASTEEQLPPAIILIPFVFLAYKTQAQSKSYVPRSQDMYDRRGWLLQVGWLAAIGDGRVEVQLAYTTCTRTTTSFLWTLDANIEQEPCAVVTGCVMIITIAEYGRLGQNTCRAHCRRVQ